MSAAVMVLIPEPVACPDCGGEGVRRFNAHVNADGVAEYDEAQCVACSGSGAVPAELVRACESCPAAYFAELGGCPHADLCPECGPLCDDCRRDAAEDLAYDTWRELQVLGGDQR